MTTRSTSGGGWHPRLRERAGTWPTRLADAIAADVASGRLAAGTRLPTQRALAKKLGITPGTVNRAYAVAERAGLVRGEVGRGTFVLPVPAEGIHERGLRGAATGAIDLALNYPPGLEVESALRAALLDLARSPPAAPVDVTGYGGAARHREIGARWLGRFGVDAQPSRVVVTTSVQHGLAAALALLAAPGETVLAEALTSPSLKGLAAQHHLRVVPVDCDAQGLIPEALTEARDLTGARLLYTVPTLHTPTAATMLLPRRRAIAEILTRTGLTAIEDDAWGFLAEGALPPLAALAPERVVYLTSVSKSLAPGLRVGYAACPERLVPALVACLGATTWAMPLGAELVARWIEDGTAERIAKRRTDTARDRLRLAALRLGERFTMPALPSYHIWIPLPEPWRAEAFIAQASTLGVALAPTDSFVAARGAAPHAVRVCLGTERSVVRLERGLDILLEMLRSGPGAAALRGF